jgi:integrase
VLEGEHRSQWATMSHLDREEALRYLDACEDWHRPLAEILISAGLRIGEAIALE